MSSETPKISADWMADMWQQANQITPALWDGYFGMEAHDWEEAGVIEQDDVHVVISKVNKYLNAHIENGVWKGQ